MNRGVIPNKATLDQFVNLMMEIEKVLKEDEYIGIHCTNGIHRTGYMIIYYICKVHNISLNLAFDTFNTIRAPH